MTHQRPVASRRTRPAKAPLSREVIVATGLDILARDGLSGLSLRKVAAALDTGPASLYVYMQGLGELHALMLDQALADCPAPDSRGGAWRERLIAYLLGYLRVLLARPGLAQLAMTTVAVGPNALRILEHILGLLREGGVADGPAAWGADLLLLYATAVAAEQSNWREHGESPGRIQNALSDVSPADFPLVFALRETMLAGGGEERAAWALGVIIDGVAGDMGRRATPDTI